MTEFIKTPTCAGLAQALALLAGRFGVSVSPDAIIHGLPLVKNQLTVSFVDEAATRAELVLEPLGANLAKPAHCPLLLAHRDGRALVITEIKAGELGIAVSDRGHSGGVLMAGLAAEGFHACWTVRPVSSRDARTGSGHEPQTHWIVKSLWLNQDVLWPVVVATVTVNVLALAVPLISMNILDRVVSHAAFETLWALAIGGVIAVAVDFILRMLRGSLVDRASARSDVILSNRIFGKVLGGRLAAQRSSVGVQSNSLREYESLREIFNSATVATMGDLPFALLFFVVVWQVAGPLVLVPLAVVPLLLIAGFATQWTLERTAAEHFKDTAHKNAVAIEILSGLETIKTHAAESWAAAKWESAVAGHLRHSLELRWWTALSTNLITALQSLTTIAILVVGVYLVVGKTISPGALFAAIMLAGRSLTPIAQVASLLTKIHHAKSAYKAIRLLTDIEQERPPAMQFLSPPPSFSALKLDRVELSYGQSGPAVLKNISLHIAPGERLGIIGSIGSGKSSLLRVLLGLRQPTSGIISMAGLPLGQIDPAAYRRLFGTAFRDEAFFFGTIRENLCLERPDASDREVREAVRLGGALDWIKALPANFATMLGEAGQGLSSGQRQTLALSRAFLGLSSAVILDEPTSDLDARTEAEFVQRLRQLPKETTLIVVTHRPAVLDACTRLLVLDQGGILMDGEKTIVLARLKQIVHSQRIAAEASG